MRWEKLGEGDRDAQNPPEITGHDFFVYKWFSNNCSLFTKDFNLMPYLLNDLELAGDEKELFIYKLGMIYQSFYDMEMKKIKAEQKKMERQIKTPRLSKWRK